VTIKSAAKQRQEDEYRVALIDALIRNRGKVRDAARQLGVSREWVRRWVKRLDLDLDAYRKREYRVLLSGVTIGIVRGSDVSDALEAAVRQHRIPAADMPNVTVVQEVSDD
jgi:DNA-binding Lrp family transcriptional regulator